MSSEESVAEPGHGQNIVVHLAHQLESGMLRSEEPGKAFICEHVVRNIWSNRNHIRDLLNDEWRDDDEIDLIQRHLIKILSILILIGSDDLLNTYCERYLGNLEFTDSKLPFDREKARQFLDRRKAQLFLDQQYKFIPALIEEDSSDNHQEIPHQFRLPFVYERSEIARGGYGIIDEVCVAPGYLKSRDGSSNWPDPRPLALKRIQSQQDAQRFHEETRVLRCLKESLCSHSRIMLYVSSIIHGTSLDILLPLAEYRDLEIFLNCGYDSESPPQKIYDFEDAFPSCKTPEFPMEVITEFSHVADGLRWLHDELTVGGDHDVFCAHMDLKPDNILVARDQRCPVGKWMLSDFGLSIFKKSTGELSRNARTVRDVISPRTHARRAPGTYQAPEVQFREDTMVGRKSDVWSMACIFSEVLIFTIEGKDSLDTFRNKRISHGNDYFYSIEAGDRLVAGPIQEYQVKRLIIDALDELAEETLDTPQKAWVKCGIRVIVKSLTIDQDRRPDASKFHRYLRHIRAHCLASSTGEEIRCPQEILDCEQSSSSRVPSLGSIGVGEITSSSRNNSIPNSSVSRKLEGSPRRTSVKTWPRDKARRPRDRRAIALCPQGQRVGYLFADCIYVYSLNEGEINPSPVVVSLSPDMDLTHLQVSDSYLVAWGRSNSSYSSRTVLVCNLDDPFQPLAVPDQARVANLPGVAISSNGVVAYNRGSTILLSFLLHHGQCIEIRAAESYQFSHAAFDRSGNYLYAWSYGSGDHHANIWSIGQDVSYSSFYFGHYATNQFSDNLCSMLPYQNQEGCIIRAPGKEFFPLQLSQGGGDRDTFERHTARLPDVMMACVYEKDSLIAVKRRFRRFRWTDFLVEYLICHGQGSVLCIDRTEKALTKCKRPISQKSKMAVVRNDTQMLVIIANWNFSVDTIAFTT